MKTLFGIGLSLVMLFNSGCTGLRVRPDAASIVVPKAHGPIPVTVGITSVDQKLTGGFPDVAPIFKRHLEESRLFQKVYYPTRPTDQLDGGITLHLNGRLEADGALFPKAFLTGFFLLLPTPLVWYNHEYQAECTLDVMRGDQKLKNYTAKAVVVASHQLFGPADILEAEGTEAATKLLCARVIEELQKDRAFLEKELAVRKTAAAQ